MHPDRTRSARRENLFGGTGVVWVQQLAADDALPSPFTVVLLCELEPAGRVGAHAQPHDDEILLGLEGDAVLYVDRVPHAVVPGRVVGLPLGATLEIDNASTAEPFRYLIIKARSPPPVTTHP